MWKIFARKFTGWKKVNYGTLDYMYMYVHEAGPHLRCHCYVLWLWTFHIQCTNKKGNLNVVNLLWVKFSGLIIFIQSNHLDDCMLLIFHGINVSWIYFLVLHKHKSNLATKVCYYILSSIIHVCASISCNLHMT